MSQPDLMPEIEVKQMSSPFDLVQDQGAEGTGWDDGDWFDNPVIEQSESAPEQIECESVGPIEQNTRGELKIMFKK